METYSISGFYRYNGSQGELSGEIEIDPDGFFEKMIEDSLSVFPQTIRGSIKDTDLTTILSFFKFPAIYNRSDEFYKYKKTKSDDFSGKYIGDCGLLPYSIEMNEKSNLLIAKIDLVAPCNGSYSELILSKK